MSTNNSQPETAECGRATIEPQPVDPAVYGIHHELIPTIASEWVGVWATCVGIGEVQICTGSVGAEVPLFATASPCDLIIPICVPGGTRLSARVRSVWAIEVTVREADPENAP